MNNLKNFKLFTENYSEELDQVLSNDENEFVVMKGDNIIAGFEILEDAFENLGELLEGESVLSEEQRYEFNDKISELSIDDEMDQFEIDEIMNELLDLFEIVEPYKIQVRSELEETPIEVEDGYTEDHLEGGEEGFDEEDEYEDIFGGEELLGESVSSEPFCIVGDLNGKTEEIDSFMDEEEANGYIPEYKSIYNEFDNMKVIHRELLESKSEEDSCDCEGCECDKGDKDKDVKCNCVKDGKCSCGDDCKCGDDCDCSDCPKSKEVKESKIKSFKDFI